ncbi:MAG: fructose-1,6-bisphosphatase [Clostridiales bacterium]|nr:fructose-1,6-bisphosphatase [Clostridiales bacterium]
MKDIKYLKLLARDYPNIEAVSSELISLKGRLSLPKGTEYFFSDLHGEHAAFIHLLRSASGVIRNKVDFLFDKTIFEDERAELASLIFYPEENLAHHERGPEFDAWCQITIHRLIMVAKEVSSKYSRSYVRRVIPPAFTFLIDELLHTPTEDEDKYNYFRTLISSVVETGVADRLIIALCQFIQHVSVDYLHIIGDIFDRGPRADMIIDELMNYHDVDIQWGNHDISWMGAASGSRVCMANVLRIAISYNGFDCLEDGYGINLRPLSMFASDIYKDDPCTRFQPHILDENKFDPVDANLAAKMHKAIAVIMFKYEGQLIQRHPEYGMDGRLLLDKINHEDGTITLDGTTYPLTDTSFPTVDPDDPYTLSTEESELMDTIAASFQHSRRLKEHMAFIYNNGALYRCYNGNLLYHGCIPMREDGSFDEVSALDNSGKTYSGRALLQHLDRLVRLTRYSEQPYESDIMWFLWCGPKSPVYGRHRMTTFERYFIDDKSLYVEHPNPYYECCEREEVVSSILTEFGLDPETSHIINGHVPVKQGENPVKANGKLFMIDGGISKAYQSKTGIAGYTLIYNSHNLSLAEHMPFNPPSNGEVAHTDTRIHVVETMHQRVTVGDIDLGMRIREKISDLTLLLKAYRSGLIRQNTPTGY